MRLGQSSVGVVEVLVFLWTLSFRHVAPLVPGDLCCLPYVAVASGRGGVVDAWFLIHGGCCHVTELGGPYVL